MLGDDNVIVSCTLIGDPRCGNLSAKAQLDQTIVLVELCGDKDSDVVNLIIVGRAAATKTDLSY